MFVMVYWIRTLWQNRCLTILRRNYDCDSSCDECMKFKFIEPLWLDWIGIFFTICVIVIEKAIAIQNGIHRVFNKHRKKIKSHKWNSKLTWSKWFRAKCTKTAWVVRVIQLIKYHWCHNLDWRNRGRKLIFRLRVRIKILIKVLIKSFNFDFVNTK